jgi:hypothetical protein
MASGHGYRANRPNTWLLRPTLQSEDSSCQPGAVHTWPNSVDRVTSTPGTQNLQYLLNSIPSPFRSDGLDKVRGSVPCMLQGGTTKPA